MKLSGIQKTRLKKSLETQSIINEMRRQDIFLETILSLLSENTRKELIKAIK